jgi:isochorismate synthase EntC
VGIVEGSVPSAEWSETELKLEAVVDAVRAVTRDVART